MGRRTARTLRDGQSSCRAATATVRPIPVAQKKQTQDTTDKTPATRTSDSLTH